MSELRVAKRYIQGFIQVAREHDCVDQAEQALRRFDGVLREHRDIAKILYHPSFPRGRKKKLISTVLGDDVPAVLKRFLEYILDKKREGIYELLYGEYKRAADELRGIVQATVVSATGLSGDQARRLRAALETLLGKKVECTFDLDATLIGGIRVAVGTAVIDGTVRRKLTRLHQHLLSRAQYVRHVA